MSALNLIDGGKETWRDDLAKGRDGYKATLWNLVLILEKHSLWAKAFKFNEFANSIDVVRPVPWRRPAGESFSEADAMELAAWLGDPQTFEIGVGVDRVLEAVECVARRYRYNPLVEYLRGLTWDGTPRVSRVLIDYFGGDDTPYNRRVGEILLVSAVARAINPGCQVDTMVVFEGAQGTGKTSAMRLLFGAPYYAEAKESPTSKDFYVTLQGRWCVEIEEMESFSKADTKKVKQAVSCRTDTFRPPYGRLARTFPRQCVFVGTTNEDQYLRDATGARRFLPMRVRSVNLSALRQARDQLWAEAMVLLDRDLDYWTQPKDAADEQEGRYEADSWEDMIRAWLQRPDLHSTDGWPPRLDLAGVQLRASQWLDVVEVEPGEHVYQLRWCTSSEVMTHALKIELARQGRNEQMRVAAAMKRLGYRQQQCGPARQRRWVREASSANNLTDPEQPGRTTV